MKAKKLLRNLFYVKVWMEVETTKQISFSLGEKHQPLSLCVCVHRFGTALVIQYGYQRKQNGAEVFTADMWGGGIPQI